MNGKKTVFVTGANRGIGKETTEMFAASGWDIVAHARKKSGEFEKFIEECSQRHGIDILPVYFDMTDESAMKAQIKERVSAKKIEINALVNNAGVLEVKLFLLSPISSVKDLFEVNLFSHMRLTQLIIKRMADGGAIVNTASIDGIEPKRGESAYASSKAAMIAWTKVLSQELSGKIRVNAIAPHAVDTDMARKYENKADWKGEELLEAKDVAKIIFETVQNESVTGDVIEI